MIKKDKRIREFEINYKKKIIEMIQNINNKDFLIRIYSFVKVKYDKENQ